MARGFTLNGVRYAHVEHPMFSEMRAAAKYFGKKTEDLDKLEQMMSESFIAIRRADLTRTEAQVWALLESTSPVDMVQYDEDEPAAKTEYVPDPLGEGTQTDHSYIEPSPAPVR